MKKYSSKAYQAIRQIMEVLFYTLRDLSESNMRLKESALFAAQATKRVYDDEQTKQEFEKNALTIAKLLYPRTRFKESLLTEQGFENFQKQLSKKTVYERTADELLEGEKLEQAYYYASDPTTLMFDGIEPLLLLIEFAVTRFFREKIDSNEVFELIFNQWIDECKKADEFDNWNLISDTFESLAVCYNFNQDKAVQSFYNALKKQENANEIIDDLYYEFINVFKDYCNDLTFMQNDLKKRIPNDPTFFCYEYHDVLTKKCGLTEEEIQEVANAHLES